MAHEVARMSYPAGFTALRESAALGAVSSRQSIGVAGPDRAAYLQGLLTNDVEALRPGQGCYAAWLTSHGRMLTDLHVLESGDMILLDVPSSQHAATLARLEQFLFSENVQLADLSASLVSIWIHGPKAPAMVERVSSGVSGLSEWAQYQNTRATIAGSPVVIARIDQLSVPAFCLYIDHAQAGVVTKALADAGAARASAEALEVARLESGYPLFGVDMTADTIPLEAGIESRAISMSKGCYVGQEIIVRVLHRGQGRVAKRLVRLEIEDAVPAPGSRLFSGEREVGRVTSAARSADRGPIALGYVLRELATVGTIVDVEIDSHRSHATVTAVIGGLPAQ